MHVAKSLAIRTVAVSNLFQKAPPVHQTIAVFIFCITYDSEFQNIVQLAFWFHSITVSADQVTGTLKMLKDQEHDTHLYSGRSESCLIYLVLQTCLFFSVDNVFVSTTLTTLIIVHITSIFIFPYLCHVKLNIYARLLCKNISELKLYVLRTSYWWDIRAIYRQYFEILDVNIVNRWF